MFSTLTTATAFWGQQTCKLAVGLEYCCCGGKRVVLFPFFCIRTTQYLDAHARNVFGQSIPTHVRRCIDGDTLTPGTIPVQQCIRRVLSFPFVSTLNMPDSKTLSNACSKQQLKIPSFLTPKTNHTMHPHVSTGMARCHFSTDVSATGLNRHKTRFVRGSVVSLTFWNCAHVFCRKILGISVGLLSEFFVPPED